MPALHSRRDPDLLQLRMQLGDFQQEQRESVTTAPLEANYISGYGGQCAFSLVPKSNHGWSPICANKPHGSVSSRHCSRTSFPITSRARS